MLIAQHNLNPSISLIPSIINLGSFSRSRSHLRHTSILTQPQLRPESTYRDPVCVVLCCVCVYVCVCVCVCVYNVRVFRGKGAGRRTSSESMLRSTLMSRSSAKSPWLCSEASLGRGAMHPRWSHAALVY